TAPAMPLPCMALSSMPCSAAILRTSGEDLVRRRSWSELPPLGCGAEVRGAAEGWEAVVAAVLSCLAGGPAAPRASPLASAAIAGLAAAFSGAAAAAGARGP